MSIGSFSNTYLSMQRVDQVAEYLESRGIEKSRIFLEGKGEESPIAWNNFSNGKAAPLWAGISTGMLSLR